jgi:ATP-binding cassette subfamily B (MDR/TAP) protein 1
MMGNFFQYFFAFIFCFILALYRAPVLALVSLATIPLVIILQIATQICAAPLYAGERRAFAEASTDVERSTNAIATVKAHNAQAAESVRFDRIVQRVRAILVRQALLWGFSLSLTDFLILATFVSGFWYGAKVVRDGTVSSGTVMTVFWAALLAASYLQQTVPCLTLLTKAKMSMASLLTVIQDHPTSVRPSSLVSNPFSPVSSPLHAKFGNGHSRPNSMAKIRPQRCHGEFDLRNISFAYPSRPDSLVLRDITLFIPPGETTFVVGGSGSGKSTIAQLLLRLYTPEGGDITLDNQSFGYLDDRYTGAHIAAVQQGCILFDMSVHDNVALGLAGSAVEGKADARRPKDVTRDEIVQACRMAMIHDFISSLPDGYETRLGTGGSSLSGGQRQRMAIARARIRDPTVLILGRLPLHPSGRSLHNRRGDVGSRCILACGRVREHQSLAAEPYHDRHHARFVPNRLG